MGIFDAIKDALTVDDGERLEAAQKELGKLQANLDKVREEAGPNPDAAALKRIAEAEAQVAQAKIEVDDFAAKVQGKTLEQVNEEKAAAAREAEAKAAEAKAEEEKAAAEAKAAADKAAADKAAAEAKAAADKAAAEAKAAADKAAAEKAAADKALAEKAAAEKKAAELRTYTVKKGDTLSEIGQKFGVNWREIAKLNNLSNPDLIFPGQVFKIPNK